MLKNLIGILVLGNLMIAHAIDVRPWNYYHDNHAHTIVNASQELYAYIDKKDNTKRLSFVFMIDDFSCNSNNSLPTNIYINNMYINMTGICTNGKNNKGIFRYLFKNKKDMNNIVKQIKRAPKHIIFEERISGINLPISAIGFTKTWNQFKLNNKIKIEPTFSEIENNCNKGDFHACGYIGVKYMQGNGIAQNQKKGLGYLKKLCDASRSDLGSANACSIIGRAYYSGIGIKYNLIHAQDYYRAGCSLGSSASCDMYSRIKEIQPTQEDIVDSMYEELKFW